MTTNQPTQLRMNEHERQQTYQAAVAAYHIINQKHEALNKYRNEALEFAANNPGSYSFYFNMDFMKVTHKLMMGYVRNAYAQSQRRTIKSRKRVFKIFLNISAQKRYILQKTLKLNHAPNIFVMKGSLN